MTPTPVLLSNLIRRLPLLVLALMASISTQQILAEKFESETSESAHATLPDSPGTLYSSSLERSSLVDEAFDNPFTNTGRKQVAAPYVKLIFSGQQAPKQEPHDKVLLGLRESVTPFAMLGWLASAGWAQLIDGIPNYGTNGKAFSQRLGAAAALSTSKEIFSDAVLATAFHQDPRYYQLGKSHKFINRVLYAGTRPIIGRTDSGKTIPNYAFMLGTAGAAALTRTYYPEQNLNGGQVARAWATSLGGSAFGSLVSEFGGEVIGWLRVGRH